MSRFWGVACGVLWGFSSTYRAALWGGVRAVVVNHEEGQVKFRTSRGAVALAACLLGLAGAPILRVVAQEMDPSADTEEGSGDEDIDTGDEVTDGGVDAGDQTDDSEEPNMSVDPTVDADGNMSVDPGENEEGEEPDETPDAGAGDGEGNTDESTNVDATVDVTPDAGASEKTKCAPELRLYSDDTCSDTALEPNIKPYTPQYALWSDNANKKRWVYLPPKIDSDSQRIDAKNPDRWVFPVGTRLYKEFSRGGVRMETRIIERVADKGDGNDWTLVSWKWTGPKTVQRADAGDTFKAPNGETHTIPTAQQCKDCHHPSDMDPVLGFSAIQLNWVPNDDFAPRVNKLQELVSETRFKNVKADDTKMVADAVIASDPNESDAFNTIQRDALGYLHGNCGHCHGQGDGNPRRGTAREARGFPDLWAKVALNSPDLQPAKVNACNQETFFGHPQYSGNMRLDISADGKKDHNKSAIFFRMNYINKSPTEFVRMPRIGSNQLDPDGLKKIGDWIDELKTCPTPAK